MEFISVKDKINYIKIKYSDFENISHYIKASVKLIGEKEMFVCAK